MFLKKMMACTMSMMMLFGMTSAYRVNTAVAEDLDENTTQIVIPVTRDTYIQGFSAQENTYWGNEEYENWDNTILRARDQNNTSSGQYVIPYVQFKLPAKSDVPNAYCITSAKIRMYIKSNENTSDVKYFVGASKLNDTDEGIAAFSPDNTEKPINYRNMHSYEFNRDYAVGEKKLLDLSPLKIADSTTTISAGAGGWVEFDITSKVRSMVVANDAPREAVFAICYESGGSNQKYVDFYSQEYADETLRPQLVIEAPKPDENATKQILLDEDFSRFDSITGGEASLSGAAGQSGQAGGKWVTYNESGLDLVTEENSNNYLQFSTTENKRTGYKFEFTDIIIPENNQQMVVESKIKVQSNADISGVDKTANISLGIPDRNNSVQNNARVAFSPNSIPEMSLITTAADALSGADNFNGFSNAAEAGPLPDEWYWVRFCSDFQGDGDFQVWGSRDGVKYTKMTIEGADTFPFIGGLSVEPGRNGLRNIIFDINYNGNEDLDVTACLDDVKVYLEMIPTASYEELYFEDFSDAKIEFDEGYQYLKGTDERGEWELDVRNAGMGAAEISDEYGTKVLKFSKNTDEEIEDYYDYMIDMTLNNPINAAAYKTITVESRLRSSEIAAGKMQLPYVYSDAYDENSVVTNIEITSDGYFAIGDQKSSMKFEPDKWYTVKLIMNFEANTADLVVNGITAVKDAAFTNPSSSVERVAYNLKNKSDLYIDYISIVGGEEQADIVFEEEGLGYVSGMNKSIKVTAKPENATGMADLFVAAYNKDGNLYKVSVAHTEDASEGISAVIDMTDVEDPDAYTIRAFIWNDTMMPFAMHSVRTLNDSPELQR